MWVKILGTVCVAVFVGAAVVEYKQIHSSKKKSGHHDPDHLAASPVTAQDES